MELFKLFGTILIDNDKANQSLHKTDQQAQSSGNKISSTFKKVGLAVAAGFSIAKIKDFAKGCMDAAAVQAEAELKLETIMKQRMKASDKSIQSVKDLASAQQKLGVVGDEVQLMGAQQLSTFLNTDKSLKTLIPAMNNLAVQQKGVNVSSGDMVNIGNMMGKVMQGQTGALKKVGITFDAAQEKILKYGTETEKAAALAQIITDNVGNMNEAFAKTDDGKIQQAKNNFGDLKEMIGNYLTPVVAKFYGWMDKITVFVMANLKPAIEGIGNVFTTISQSFSSNSENMNGVWNQIGKPIFDGFLNVLQTLKQAWDIMFPAIMTLWSSFWSTIGVLWDSIGKPIFAFVMMVVGELVSFFASNMPMIAAIVSDVFNMISSYWTGILQPVFTIIGNFIQTYLLPVFTIVFKGIMSAVQAAFNAIGNLWNDSLKPILNGIISFISGIFSGDWSKVWNGILSVITGIWGGMKNILLSPIQWFIDWIQGIGERVGGPFNDAATAIGDVWKAIKSLFKLPHFKFHGSMNPIDWITKGDTPSISVEWYAKGGIMNNPYMFGMNPYSGKAMVGGEAGPEAIAPLSKLEEYYKKWSNEGNNEMVSLLSDIRNYLSDDERWYRIFLKALTDGSFSIVMDGREVGRIVRKYA